MQLMLFANSYFMEINSSKLESELAVVSGQTQDSNTRFAALQCVTQLDSLG